MNLCNSRKEITLTSVKRPKLCILPTLLKKDFEIT